MGKVGAFSIHFDPPQAVFFAGRTITGYVILILNRMKSLRAINLNLTGESYVSFRDQGDKTKHTAKVELVKETIALLDGQMMAEEMGEKNYQQPAGTHQYPFCIPLSSHLPSSFESKNGYIRYVLQAKLEKPKKSNKAMEVQCGIEVHQWIDPNDRLYGAEVAMEADCWISTACCFGGNVHLQTTLPRTCYSPGDVVTFNCDVTNGSRVNMGKVNGKVVQKIKYMTPEGGSKTVCRDIGSVVGPSMSRNTLERWWNVEVPLPTYDFPPTISKCTLISVCYSFLVCLGNGEYVLNNEFDVVVGTVPYVMDVVQSQHY